MTQQYKTPEEWVALHVLCEFCGAQPGAWCVSRRSGQVKPKYLHKVRLHDGAMTQQTGVPRAQPERAPERSRRPRIVGQPPTRH